MRAIALAAMVAVALAALPARTQPAEAQAFEAAFLALLAHLVHRVARSEDPGAAQGVIAAVLEGKDPEANRLANVVVDEFAAELPQEQRASLVALGRDLLVLARRAQRAGAPACAEGVSASGIQPDASVIETRRQLAAMGSRDGDEEQLLAGCSARAASPSSSSLPERGLERSSTVSR